MEIEHLGIPTLDTVKTKLLVIGTAEFSEPERSASHVAKGW